LITPSQQLIELGHLAVMLALPAALLQALSPLLARALRRPQLAGIAVRGAWLQLLLAMLGWAALTQAFVSDNFSVWYVAQNANSALPLIYKITAVWGGHEGSLYLWYVILAAWTAALAWYGRRHFPDRLPVALAVQGALCVGFLGLILFLSNPFARLLPVPVDGRDLNPLLQDPGMAIHPPMLYMGYVGFSIPFAMVLTALLTRWPAEDWLPMVRRWALAAFGFLTIGIVLGGAWAYYELGWGGYWAWDPVENASFMPWLTGAALVHSLMVQEQRRLLASWNLFLAILTFSLSLLGTFLVRSGVLSSVHAFAVDPGRGAYILVFLALVVGGAFGVFLWRGGQAQANPRPTAWLSRESLLLANNVLFTVAGACVFLGTLYPLFLDVTAEQKITVAAPYFNSVVVPQLLLLVLLMGLTPSLPWRRAQPRAVWARLRWQASIGLVAGALTLALARPVSVLAAIAVGFAAFALATVAADLLRGGRSLAAAERRALVGAVWLNAWRARRHYGALLAHVGVAVATVGLAAAGLFRQHSMVTMVPGDVLELAGHRVELVSVGPARGPNYDAERAVFRLDGTLTLLSERRSYHASRMPTTESGIHSTPLRDVYVVLGETRDGRHTVSVYVNPLVQWIWAGGALIGLGVLMCLGERAPRRAG
jgi:cytochrome c-type biogenesis protein CcmF